MEFQVRPARIEDRGPLLDLWERSVRRTHRFLRDRDVVTLRPLVARELACDAIEWWVLESAADLVGFLGVADEAIEGLFVDPEHRRQGAGRFLVAHAQLLGAGALAVDVNEQNEEALRFYEALGFRVIGRSPTDWGGRGLPILHMRRAAPLALQQQRFRASGGAPRIADVADIIESCKCHFIFASQGLCAISRAPSTCTAAALDFASSEASRITRGSTG
ncbi:MAG TPA: GNAT family N-acetyltransferase [Burkholderiaceae bacterium]|nr:GNAT family N-acetyltransferase [Burkholderiaceae bacterium]